MPTEKPPRLLTWRRTRIGGDIIYDDFVGHLKGSPGECRVMRTTSSGSLPPWKWIANGTHFIADGYVDTPEDGVEAAEKAYAAWRERAEKAGFTSG